MGPHFSPRGRSRDRSRFGPGDVPGPNPNPSSGSLPKRTQCQRLTTPRAWRPEEVQADSAWTLEAHHAESQARLQLPRGFRRPPRPGAQSRVWPWQPKTDPDRQPPLCPQPTPSGRPRACCGFAPGASWELTLTLTLPRTGTLHRNLSLPRTLTLQVSRLRAWALTSALEGDHETGVASALATSLDQTLTLAKAPSPWGPHANV